MLGPHAARACARIWPAARRRKPKELSRILAFIAGNEQFFLNIAMVMATTMDPVKGIAAPPWSPRCAATAPISACAFRRGDRWFTAPVEMPQGLYFPGFQRGDANPDMGDSAIVETIGLGAFAMAAAPAVVGFVGAGSASEAANFTRAMREITVARTRVDHPGDG